ncbi:MAG: hypothetical protein Q8O29_08110 [Polaromonas sp.]|uniref:hypothetical protein n=1 Tax=Polaromonas sp. TaxID=1869339 RepID=UPI002733A6DD|nr:hypothetical protein [Polaromonas sp.]MDP2818232.1 hypothetical protein [Polaromonas sp.]
MKLTHPAGCVIVAGVVAALHVAKLPPALPVLQQVMGVTALGKEIGGVVISQAVPSPRSAGTPIIKEYLEVLSQTDQNPNPCAWSIWSPSHPMARWLVNRI